MVTVEPYLLTEADAAAAGDLIGAAFVAIPGPAFLFPNPARRRRLAPPLFTAMTRLVVRQGQALALGAPLQAVALWLPPGREHPTEAAFAAAGMGLAQARMNEGERTRLDALGRHFEAMHERVMDQPHWYLLFLAVAPAHQGRGAGTALLRSTLDHVIPAEVPCFLTSTDERNLPFYARLGFRIVEAGTVPGSQLRTWAMRRG
jgi:ribosomal protein S18 acetylase RimI-like enzyme